MKLKIGVIFLILLIGIAGYFVYTSLHFTAKVHTVEINGAKIAYYTRGRGEPVLLLGSFGMTMAQWDPVIIQKLSETNEVIVMDYRAVGNSTGAVSSLSKEQTMNDILGVMQALKLDTINLLGWDGGSNMAEIFTEEHADKVHKLILVAPQPGEEDIVPVSETIQKAQKAKANASWEQLVLPYLFYSDENKQAYLMRLLAAQKDKTIPQAPDESGDMIRTYNTLFADKTLEQKRIDGLGKISNSTLIISGEEDELVVPGNSERVKKLMKSAYLATVAQAGNAVLFEKPNESSQVIVEFLNQK